MIALKDSLGTEFVERIRTIFSENGLLSKAANFEFRPQQQEMAVAVARALEEDRHLVVEFIQIFTEFSFRHQGWTFSQAVITHARKEERLTSRVANHTIFSSVALDRTDRWETNQPRLRRRLQSNRGRDGNSSSRI